MDEDVIMIVDLTKPEMVLMMILVESDIKTGVSNIIRPLDGVHLLPVKTTDYAQKLKDYFVRYQIDVLYHLKPLAFDNNKVQFLIPKSNIKNVLDACRRVIATDLNEVHKNLFIMQYANLTRNLQAALDWKPDKELSINQKGPGPNYKV